MDTEAKLIGLTEVSPHELVQPEEIFSVVEQGFGEITLGELVPVEGATAEITLAYLPSCARYYVTLNFWLDFKNTSSVPISVKPHIYLIGLMDHAFSAKELEPGQSYSEKYGHYWLGAVQPLSRDMADDILRVEAGIDVYTPEGWVEVDRVAGEPFSWQYTYPLPELTITSAPEYAPAGTEVVINCELYNPGFCTPPQGHIMIDGERFPASPYVYFFPPDLSVPFTYSFIIGDQDRTITLTPYRYPPPGEAAPLAGEPVSVTIHAVTVPIYHLAIAINGEGLVLPEDVSGDYPEGTVIELTAYGAPGWWFHSWEGTDNNSANPTTVTIDSDKQVVCNFTQVAPAGCLPVVAAGILLVAGIIAGIIVLV